MKIAKVTNADVANHDKDYKRMVRMFNKHLAPQGVELPNGNLTVGLTALYQHINEAVPKDMVATYVRRVLSDPKISGDQQLRHLRASGWNIVGSGRGHTSTNHDSNGEKIPSGHYMLLSVTSPHPLWLAERRMTRAGGRLSAQTFLDLLVFYSFKCASCGADITSGADQGHKDPRKKLTVDNTIPLCTSCNNWQSKDYVLNDRGRVSALSTPRAVLQSNKAVQQDIYNTLKAKGFK